MTKITVYYKKEGLTKALFEGSDGLLYLNDGNGNMVLGGDDSYYTVDEVTELTDPEPTTNVQRTTGYYWINIYDDRVWMITLWDGHRWIAVSEDEINFIDENRITRSDHWFGAGVE